MSKHKIAVFFLVVLSGVLSGIADAEPQWTWVSGSNVTNQFGIYGTKGVADSGNVPGARQSGISWTDGSDNFWLFGGNGYAASGSSDYMNDLWKFDSNNNWTWVSGSSTTNQFGTYGTKGVAASGNVPGARIYAVSWIDGSGNLWLFGGYGRAAASMGFLNDLWKFDGTNWTWVSGSNVAEQYGVYGTKGVAASGNVPGGRFASISWTDAGGNLWLFSGQGYAVSGGNGYLNDLWKFDGTNWTWVSGANVTGQAGSYGTQGVADSGNVPGARYHSISCIDAGGNFWLFGGYGRASGTSYLNDLWKFDGTNWTWVSGSSTTDQHGTYGTKGVAASGNVPGGRYSSISWIDADDDIWLFGGQGYAASGSDARLSDLWKFDGTSWTWVSGSDVSEQYGVYGTKGLPASGNVPGARYDSISWIDADDNLWLFGGFGYTATIVGRMNDLWRFGVTELVADISGDGIVNGLDLRILADQWLTNPTASPSADIAPSPAGDDIVNFFDFALLAGEW